MCDWMISGGFYLLKDNSCARYSFYRIFDIPSTTVHGISKRFHDDVGRGYVDVRENKRCSWNAINIDGKWFLLNTNILFPPKEGELIFWILNVYLKSFRAIL